MINTECSNCEFKKDCDVFYFVDNHNYLQTWKTLCYPMQQYVQIQMELTVERNAHNKTVSDAYFQKAEQRLYYTNDEPTIGMN